MLAAPSPYANLTMKELVVKALREHFHQGATTRQLLEFFRDAWGREIERTSLSPQLTRLFAAGIISQFGEGKEWFLIPEGANRVGHHAFRNRTSGEINWKLPNQARDDDVPAKLRESSRPDLD